VDWTFCTFINFDAKAFGWRKREGKAASSMTP
jgi:hypothetical protein